MEHDFVLDEVLRQIHEHQDNPEFVKELKSLGNNPSKEDIARKVRECIERESISMSMRSGNERELPNKSLQTNFPPLSMNQVPIYKLLQHQMGFVKKKDDQPAFKGFIEDMETIYRGDFKYGKKEGIGEAVAFGDLRF